MFVVDIEFDYENATLKQMMYSEIFPPIIDQQKKLDATEKSVFQLCGQYLKIDDNKPKSYKCTKKSHVTLIPKTFISFYLTKIYTQFTFEQKRFKKNPISMNQISHQKAKN